jgi:hypothetical protein
MLMGTELISLEPKATAKAKLGVNGQWINVQDPKGDQGYVAAWYVSDTKGKPAAPATTKPVSGNTSTPSLPAGALAFLPLEQISLRSQPIVAPETLIRLVSVTEQLVSIEPANVVIPKVGVNGQWLKVRDASNREGFVAAWYVKYAGGSTAQQAANTTTATAVTGGLLKVRAAAEGVALRKQPIISDATLIKRVALGTEFAVTEPNGEAKIGKNDQWLKVKDPTGTEGVVAAWFVSR